jgi:hypothetical protein
MRTQEIVRLEPADVFNASYDFSPIEQHFGLGNNTDIGNRDLVCGFVPSFRIGSKSVRGHGLMFQERVRFSQ